MALVAERWGLIPELKQFAAENRPIWGTCAGLIFLANRATGGWNAEHSGACLLTHAPQAGGTVHGPRSYSGARPAALRCNSGKGWAASDSSCSSSQPKS